jgi:hypothetical protein
MSHTAPSKNAPFRHPGVSSESAASALPLSHQFPCFRLYADSRRPDAAKVKTNDILYVLVRLKFVLPIPMPQSILLFFQGLLASIA